MPIISKVEAKTWKGKFLFGIIFALLILGGITMVYPFLIMFSGALRSEMDESDLDLIPEYFGVDAMLYAKFLETKYNQGIANLEQVRERRYTGFREVAAEGLPAMNPLMMEDLVLFWQQSVPRHWEFYGGTYARMTTSENLRELRNRLVDYYDGDLRQFSRDTGGVMESWESVQIAAPDWLAQRYDIPATRSMDIYFAMSEEAPLAEKSLVSLTGHFRRWMNHVWPVSEAGQRVDYLPQRVPGVDQPEWRRHWLRYVLEDLNPSFVRTEGVPASRFHDWLKLRHGTIDSLNESWGSHFLSFAEIALPAGDWLRGAFRVDYLAFLRTLPPESLWLDGPEYAWTHWLVERYGSLEALNQAYGSDYATFESVRLPLEQLEASYVLGHRTSLRWQYATRNFINVFDALWIRGRALWNTVIFCALSVLSALLVNSLAAYAFSRFRFPGTYKMLLLLMATMAFPPMVTLIPTFIILQKLDLMNTFAALLLPTIASGYLIFLLKGFFDSLPRELYEAATLDGASEMRIFFQVTMPLSKPILAVVALNAFNASYTLFLYALLVAPSEDMWLISVWLYQFQQTHSMSGVFASVLIASIPTFLVFLLCQNMIMRGLVIPVEK